MVSLNKNILFFICIFQLDRTPLHYAHLFTDSPDILNRMTKLGADPKLFDAVSFEELSEI